jgi:hypothetical protein
MIARINCDKIVDFRVFYFYAHSIGGHDMTWTWRHIKTCEDGCCWTVHTKIPGSEGYTPTGELKKRLKIEAIAKGDIIITAYGITFDFDKDEQELFTKVVGNQQKKTINIDE